MPRQPGVISDELYIIQIYPERFTKLCPRTRIRRFRARNKLFEPLHCASAIHEGDVRESDGFDKVAKNVSKGYVFQRQSQNLVKARTARFVGSTNWR